MKAYTGRMDMQGPTVGVLPTPTENYTKYPMINHNGKKYFKSYMCITESLHCIAVINTALLINYTSIKKKRRMLHLGEVY